jgi:hypothetical protein
MALSGPTRPRCCCSDNSQAEQNVRSRAELLAAGLCHTHHLSVCLPLTQLWERFTTTRSRNSVCVWVCVSAYKCTVCEIVGLCRCKPVCVNVKCWVYLCMHKHIYEYESLFVNECVSAHMHNVLIWFMTVSP